MLQTVAKGRKHYLTAYAAKTERTGLIEGECNCIHNYLRTNDAELNDVREFDREDATVTNEEAESHANSECDESAAAAEEVEIPEVDETSEEENEIPVNDADAEVEIGREEILTDEEVKHRTNPEGDEVFKKVEEEIVGEETLESVTEGKNLEPLDHAVPVVLGDL
ncbi:hypothetical protein FQA39_LY12706 [Lamprigera yunnana]|nr:hypothetical protein FQA39_LY12706 [Lamprigera yunnana]